jgi:hypothetical protein
MRVEVPITEYDLEALKEVVYNNDLMEWTFLTEGGKEITIEFMSEDEYEQRRR